MGSLASYVTNMIRRLAALHYQSLLPSDYFVARSLSAAATLRKACCFASVLGR